MNGRLTTDRANAWRARRDRLLVILRRRIRPVSGAAALATEIKETVL